MALAGMATWFTVSNTLSEQKIVVSEDANCLAGNDVDGPFSAYCQAKVIDKHTKEITGGKTYAELDRDDPNRAVAADSAFLQASLFTSVVAFGVAAIAIVVGIVLTLLGFADPRARHGLAPWRVPSLTWRDRAWGRSGSQRVCRSGVHQRCSSSRCRARSSPGAGFALERPG